MNMKKILLIFICSFIITSIEAQWVSTKFRVNFKDKSNSPFSLSDPTQYLSPRSIERRLKYNIPIDYNDIPVNSWYIDSVRNIGVTILNPSKWFNSVTIYTKDLTLLTKICALPFVAGIDTVGQTPTNPGDKKPNRKMDTMEGSICNSINQSSNRDSFYYDYGYAYNQTHMISTDYLHDNGFRGEGILIGVLDAGFNNADINKVLDSVRLNNQITATKDFVSPGENVYRSSSTHGEMVFSIMAGVDPGYFIGTAPKASYTLLRTEDANSEYIIEEDNWASGAEFADSIGVDVINSSLGYTTFDDPKMNHDYSDLNGRTARASIAAGIAAKKGIIVCNSAGNSGNSAWKYISVPADADSIITVGAVTSKGVYASFSSQGPTADGRIKPTVCAQGQQTYVSSPSGEIFPGNGTSFSCPVIAGSVACLLQANKNKTNIEIINALMASSNKFDCPDDYYGYGIPDFMVANYTLKHSTPNNINLQKVIVIPNPFMDKLFINYYSQNDNNSLNIEMYDMSGKKVYSAIIKELTKGYNFIPIYNLIGIEKGNYILKLTDNNNVSDSMKIIK